MPASQARPAPAANVPSSSPASATALPVGDLDTVARLQFALGRSSRLLRESATGGLTPTQLAVLGVLLREGPRQLTELAAVERINPTLLSRVVGRLEDDGLVMRSRPGAGPPRLSGQHHRRRARSRRGPAPRAMPGPRRSAWPGLIPCTPRRSLQRFRRWKRWPISSPPTGRIDEHPYRRRPAGAGTTADSPRAGTRRSATFAALSNHNFRRFFYGQAVSMIGTWMQSVAQSWLVLELTGSGTALGLVIALQTLPVLFLAPYAGLIADRVDKRRILLGTQSAMGVLALVLGLLTVTHSVSLWMVYLLAVGLGLANAIDNPTRQSFVLEMVGQEHLRNAVTLNSVLVNAARAIGPAIAGTLIATIGVGVCFLVNAGTFAAVLSA